MSLSRVAITVVFGASLATISMAQQNSNGKGSTSGSSSNQSHQSSSSHQNTTSSHQGSGYHYGSTQHNSGSGYHGYGSTNHYGSGTNHYGSGTYHGYTRTGTTGTVHTQGNEHIDSQVEPHTYQNHVNTNVNGLGNQMSREHGAGGNFVQNATGHNSPYTGNHNFAQGYTSSSHNVAPQVYNSSPYLGRRGNWREGYYRPGWHDETFFFGFYVFSPYEAGCVVSPWYYYPCLPAYLAYNRVVIVNDNCDWNDGNEYSYAPQAAPNSYGDSDLNSAISQLQNIFENDDENAIGTVVDGDMQVGVYNDGKYMYSVKGQDFSQMMSDNAHGVQNVSFTVTDVKVQPDYAIVTARHEFQDPEDGGSSVVYQEYRLTRNGDHYAIEDFNTSKSPGGARTFF